MPPVGFECKQCGSCCLNLRDAYQGTVEEEDVKRWEMEGRDDILEWVDLILVGKDGLGMEVYVYDVWIHPKTGEDVGRCPWLRKLPGKDKYICRIHDTKPGYCRRYPLSKEHAERTGCKGFVAAK